MPSPPHPTTRRNLLLGTAGLAAAGAVGAGAEAAPAPVGEASFDSLDALSDADLSGRVAPVLVRGASTPGDARPAFFAPAASEPMHPGKRQSRDGRWWELDSPFADDAYFGGPDGRHEYTELLLAQNRQAVAPVNHPAQGLKISEFLTSDSAHADQANSLEGALDKLIGDARFSTLDLEGRTVTLSRPLQIDDDRTKNYNKPLTIANGTLVASDDWSKPDAPLVRFFSSKNARISRWGIESVKFKCLNRASAIFIDGAYITMRFRWLDIDDPHTYGIRTRGGGRESGNIRVEFCDIVSSSADASASKRVLVGLDFDNDNDGKVIGNRIVKARTALRGQLGAFLISQNHFWQGSDLPPPRSDFTPVIHLGARSTNVVAVNYIDNGITVLEEGFLNSGEARTMGYCQFTNNIFTLAEASEDSTFFAVKPTGKDRTLANMIVRNNQFRNLGPNAERVRRPFAVDSSAGGSLNPGAAQDLWIESNYFWGRVQPQSSTIGKYVKLDGRKKYPIDARGQTPFDLDVDIARSIAVRAEADPGSVFFQKSGGKTGSLQVTKGAKGQAYVELSVNRSSMFD